MKICRLHQTVSWILQILAAAILLQTLYFKFSGAEESVFIFSSLGVEPWGRVATGMIELVAAMLLLWDRAAVLGALLSIGLMIGALGGHLVKLGVVVLDDGSLLFGLALIVLASSLGVVWLRRQQLPTLRFLTHGWVARRNSSPRLS